MDASPAVGAQERIAHRPARAFQRRLPRPRLVQPTRLRHANSDRCFVPLDRMQQRNLHGQRQFRRQLQVSRAAPKQQAAGKRQQVQLGRPDMPCAPRPAELASGSNVSRYFTPVSLCLGFQSSGSVHSGNRSTLQCGSGGGVDLRHDAKASAMQIAELGRVFAVSGDQQATDKIVRTIDRPLLRAVRCKNPAKTPSRALARWRRTESSGPVPCRLASWRKPVARERRNARRPEQVFPRANTDCP